VTEWDVVNEAYSANDVQRILGDDMRNNSTINRANITDDWFRETRRISNEKKLGLKLFYNDFALLAGKGQTNKDHREWFYKFMDGLVSRGVPVDGIGCQLYYRDTSNPNTQPDGAFLYECLEKLEKYKLEIKITEFGLNEPDRKKQAEQFIDILTAAYSHPLVTSFIIWWPWDNTGSSYPNGGYFTVNNELKPMGEAYAYLVFGKWWTDAAGKSNTDGKFETRGYFGEYDLVVTHKGQTKTVPVKMLKNSDKNFTVQL
jgi:hypothetical protein